MIRVLFIENEDHAGHVLASQIPEETRLRSLHDALTSLNVMGRDLTYTLRFLQGRPWVVCRRRVQDQLGRPILDKTVRVVLDEQSREALQ